MQNHYTVGSWLFYQTRHQGWGRMNKAEARLERERIHQMFGGRCAYCGDEIPIEAMQIDHINSQRRGHAFNRDDSPENLYPACASCNWWKSTFTIDEFRKEIANKPALLLRNNSVFCLAERYGQIEIKNEPVQFYFEIKKEIKP
jgi:5-methylcytosine-specific restriction endonuclease McrA